MAKLITDSQLKELLSNSYLGTRNHYVSDCPLLDCKKQGHFYIQRDTQLWDCKKCKRSGNIFSLLQKLNKLHLLKEGGRVVDFQNPLQNKILEFSKSNSISEKDLTPAVVKLPIGYKRIYQDEYLLERGFGKIDYQDYEVGITRLKSSLKDYIIIPVIEEGKNTGYLARSKKSKEEIKLINQQYEEEGIKKKYLRWRNSTSSDFSKLLYGIDEIIPGITKSVVLVEGFFAKRKIDKVLKLREKPTVKCNATFGKNVSKYQIAKLERLGIEDIILLFDPDAVEEMKKFSFELDYFFNTLIGVINEGEDIDDVSSQRIFQIFDNLLTPLEFFNGRIGKKIKL